MDSGARCDRPESTAGRRCCAAALMEFSPAAAPLTSRLRVTSAGFNCAQMEPSQWLNERSGPRAQRMKLYLQVWKVRREEEEEEEATQLGERVKNKAGCRRGGDLFSAASAIRHTHTERLRVFRGHPRATSSPKRKRKSPSSSSPHGSNLTQARL